jgi:hypothetical protein
MLLISRFESYLKMCGFEMGCDKKWSQSQIEESQNKPCAIVRISTEVSGILDRQKTVKRPKSENTKPDKIFFHF